MNSKYLTGTPELSAGSPQADAMVDGPQGRHHGSPAQVQPCRSASPASSRPGSSHAARNPPLSSRLAIFYYCVSFGYFMWCWLAAILVCRAFPALWPGLAAYSLYIFGPGATATYDGSWPTPWRTWWMWRSAAAYFPCTLHKTAELPPGRPYLFGYHPHGILSFGAWLSMGTDALGLSRKFPGIDIRLLTLNINFRAPFLREYLLLHGICSVSRHACLRMLSGGKSVVIAIGGGSESLLARPGSYDLVLRRRRGFVKIALRTGAALVPCLAFGEQEVFRTVNELPHASPLRRFQRGLEKLTGFTIPLAYGRGLFLPVGMLPYPTPIDVVVGAPIEVEKYTGETGGAEFEAQVDKLHGQYVAALQRLFEDNKDTYAKGAKGLRLVE